MKGSLLVAQRSLGEGSSCKGTGSWGRLAGGSLTPQGNGGRGFVGFGSEEGLGGQGQGTGVGGGVAGIVGGKSSMGGGRASSASGGEVSPTSGEE